MASESMISEGNLDGDLALAEARGVLAGALCYRRAARRRPALPESHAPQPESHDRQPESHDRQPASVGKE